MPKMFSDTLVNIIFEYQLNIRLHHFSVNWRALPLASWYHSWGGGGVSGSFLALHHGFCVYALITALQNLKGQFRKRRSQEGIALDKNDGASELQAAFSVTPTCLSCACRVGGSRRRGVKVTQLDSGRTRGQFFDSEVFRSAELLISN